MAEVTNTPWGERHSYVLSASKDTRGKIKSTMKKELHVSPFWDMDHLYDWSFSSPTEKLGVYMKNFKEGEKGKRSRRVRSARGPIRSGVRDCLGFGWVEDFA